MAALKKRSDQIHGWSMGFNKYRTTTTAAQWERKWAWRGALAAVVAGSLAAFPAFTGIVVIGTAAGAGFYRYLNRDIEE